MGKIGWRFPPLFGGTRQTYTSNDIEGFKGEELIDNIAREICQNSLDAKNKKLNKPVEIVYELKHIPVQQYKAIREYQKCLDGCYAYWGNEMDNRLSDFLKEAEAAITQDIVSVLIVSDYNTTGLNGICGKKLFSPWEALTGSDGMSVKDSKDSSGSYGIGKNAPFACSSLSMVFYNTKVDEGQAFIGVARLATLKDENGRATQRVGKYQNNDDENEIWKPLYEDDEDDFRKLVNRKENGTDVIIVGFNQEDHWMDNIEKAILKNFFVSIQERKLVVKFIEGNNVKYIDSTNIASRISFYKDKPKMAETYQMYMAFTEPSEHSQLSVLRDSLGESNNIDVYIKADSSYKKTIGNFRSTGMLVGTYYRRIFQHYAAVVIVRGEKLGELLKKTEPPRHNRWDYKLISKNEREERKNAKEAIKYIEEEVYKLILKQFTNISEESTDAVGISEYLPDEDDGFISKENGNDILRVKVKLGAIRRKIQNDGNGIETGNVKNGERELGHLRLKGSQNKRKSSKENNKTHLTKNPSRSNQATSKTKRTDIIETPELNAQRAYPVNADIGLYKIVIRPTQDYNKLYIRCAACGEDGKQDPLKFNKFVYKSVNVLLTEEGFKAGPIAVKANEIANFFVTFAEKGKFQLMIDLKAVIRR